MYKKNPGGNTGVFFYACASMSPHVWVRLSLVGHKNTNQMANKKVIIAVLVGVAVGYMAQNYIAGIPVVNKLPILGSK